MSDLIRVVRAAATNQLARLSPSLYVRLTGQTGRGSGTETSKDIASYFLASLDDYFVQLKIEPANISSFLAGKTLMEYGPGDLPAVAVLMVAMGAEKVYCVDRFPLVNLSSRNLGVLQKLIDGCEGERLERLLSCLKDKDDLSQGFDARRIEYLVKPSGMSGLNDVVDLVYSRAVLEHVNDLPGTFADMLRAMRVGARSIHLVDLRSHGLHKTNVLDFLAWSPTLWSLMYSEKGVPNRWRVNEYRRILAELKVSANLFEPTAFASPAEIADIRGNLAPLFRDVSDADLAWLGFWLGFENRSV